MQLLSGTALENDKAASHVEGFLSAGREVSLRWQSKAAEVARNALIAVETTAGALVTPAVIKVATTLHYELLQASVPRLRIALPAGQSLTRLQGEQIRDWNVAADGARSVLSIEFIKPVEKKYELALFSEQAIASHALHHRDHRAATAGHRARIRFLHRYRRRHGGGHRLRRPGCGGSTPAGRRWRRSNFPRARFRSRPMSSGSSRC